jgi:hypothetical protein
MIFIGYSLLTRIYNPLTTFFVNRIKIPNFDFLIMRFQVKPISMQPLVVRPNR